MRNFLEEFHAIFLYRDKFKCSFWNFYLLLSFQMFGGGFGGFGGFGGMQGESDDKPEPKK